MIFLPLMTVLDLDPVEWNLKCKDKDKTEKKMISGSLRQHKGRPVCHVKPGADLE